MSQQSTHQKKQRSGFDLIGDVHGCAKTLIALLEKLGYRQQDGVYQHPERQVIFIGDIIDRGTGVRESLHIVHDMVAAGQAQIVLGNHEYHALAYATPIDDPGLPEEQRFLRHHTARHYSQLKATLTQFEAYPDEWQHFLDWFRTIPLYLELPQLRAVHACWDQRLIDQLKEQGINDLSDPEFLKASVSVGEFAWKVADRLLRGTYLPLPDGEVMEGFDGYRRRAYRTKFWVPEPEVHEDIVFQPDPLPEHIATKTLTEQEKSRLIFYGNDERPVFMGHYWQKGRPKAITHNIACLDYSAVRKGKLVAYRMDDEARLDDSKFVWVDMDPRDINTTK